MKDPKDISMVEKFIVNKEDLETLKKYASEETQRAVFVESVYLDFEQMKASGIDAFEVSLSYKMYYMFYGWDVSSILVMNKDVIVPL